MSQSAPSRQGPFEGREEDVVEGKWWRSKKNNKIKKTDKNPPYSNSFGYWFSVSFHIFFMFDRLIAIRFRPFNAKSNHRLIGSLDLNSFPSIIMPQVMSPVVLPQRYWLVFIDMPSR